MIMNKIKFKRIYTGRSKPGTLEINFNPKFDFIKSGQCIISDDFFSFSSQ